MPDNHLYYGDNLDILRHTKPVYIPAESVDLIYLDPPFNSNADYNVLFREKDGNRAAAQIQAFTDTWEWDEASASAYRDVLSQAGEPAKAMKAFEGLLGHNDMLAYLAMMAVRLIELRRVLKPTGSIYLHCDSTANHYLKVLMDAIFGLKNYRNEIIWKRTNAHNDAKRFGRIHDVLLYYAKDAAQVVFNPVYVAYSPEYLKAEFRQDNGGRWYKTEDLTAPSHGSESGRFEFHGRVPGPSRMWRMNQAEMERLWSEGRIKTDSNGIPLLRGQIVYLDEKKGMPVQDIWDDILRVGNTADERLGYPTQKPEALLERIVQASSNPGDVVLDPFCGCGTAIAAAQKLGRHWIGIDVTHVAIGLMKSRLQDTFGPDITKQYDVTGEPTTLPDAVKLAAEDKFQFQAWALGLVGARTATSANKGADGGVDGRLFFQEGGGDTKEVILSVKGGTLKADDIRALGQVVTNEGADMGVLITLNEPTAGMRGDAASAGEYTSPWGRHPRLQILTIKELLEGKKIDMPQTQGINITFKQAPKAKVTANVPGQLPLMGKE